MDYSHGSYPAAHDVNAFPDDEANPRVLYVGNLPPTVNEDLLMTIFSKVGQVIRCKMIPDGVMKYAFVEFTDNSQAAAVKSFMNEREIHGSKIRINWKTQPKKDTSNHYHIFVGDLSPEVTNEDLFRLFRKWGDVSDAKVIRDALTNKSKGYGFVSFVNKKEAETAKDSLNGTTVGSRAIRINWAARKPAHGGTTGDEAVDKTIKAQNIRTISSQASKTNTTVYVGNVTACISETSLRQVFEDYGPIQSINMFPQKGYAFVIFADHESAAKAIAFGNGGKVDNVRVKCNWGRENPRLESRPDYPDYPNYGYGEDRTFDDANQSYAPSAASAAAPAGQYDYNNYGYGGGYDPNYYYSQGGHGQYPPPMYPPQGPPPGAYPPPGPYGHGPPPPHGGYGAPPPGPGYGPPLGAPGYPPMDPNYPPAGGYAGPSGGPGPNGYKQEL